MDERLKRAKKFLAIAESADARKEAYKMAAEEIAAYKAATGASNRDIAISLGRNEAKEQTIQKLLAWRKAGYKSDTPFLMDKQATSRAAFSHAKKVLRDATPEQMRDLLDQPNVIPKVVQAAAALNPKPVDMRSEIEKEADKAKDSELEAFGRPRERVPVWINKAVGDVKWFIEHDRQMEEGEYWLSIEAMLELGHELWVYGAQRGHDVSQLTHELERWREMLGDDE